MRHLGRHAQQHFGGGFGKPHVVFGLDVVQVRALGGEGVRGIHLQTLHQRHAEVFQPPGLFGGQVPHAAPVDQTVGLHLARFGFVGEVADVPGFDSALQLRKQRAARAQVFVRQGLHLGAALQWRRFQLL